jgi:hypothetical protein
MHMQYRFDTYELLEAALDNIVLEMVILRKN